MKLDNKNITRKERITVAYFYEYAKENFGLISFTGKIGLDRYITEQNLHRPGLALAGFVGLFSYPRIQVFGNTEISYLKNLSEKQRKLSLKKLMEFEIPCIILSNGVKPFKDMLELAKKRNIAIFGSNLSTTKLIYYLGDFLEDQFAYRFTIHGSLVDVYGVGMLFVGKSGIGKSEVALDLVERGHRLVADDVVILTKKGEGIIMGSGTDLTAHFMEIRGIGIIDVRSMFGVRAIRFQKRVEVVIDLEIWDSKAEYTRTGLDNSTIPLMEVDIPYVKLPIIPGKNITVVSEVIALNYLLKHYNYDAAKVLTERLKQKLKVKEASSDRIIDYFEHDFE